ncbi:MAG: cupin domain-containing protein, partial [Proteobacteria bacterium]|nr:cupin domain-containing protein [Pseudomonadota bacterium]
MGYHYHDALEEWVVVLAGSGQMTIADHTFEVSAGSVTFQGIAEAHGIYNPNRDEELDFLRIAVAVPGEAVTSI